MSEPLGPAQTAQCESQGDSGGTITNEEIQTCFIPAGDGPMQGMPQSWNGALSGIRFSSHWEEEFPVLTIHLEAEIPLEVHERMRDEACLASQAEAFDLALKVAIDGEISSEKIAGHAVGLTWVRNHLARSYNHLSASLEANRQDMAPGPENLQKYRRSRRSIEVLKRTVERIDARMKIAVPGPIAGALIIGDPSPDFH